MRALVLALGVVASSGVAPTLARAELKDADFADYEPPKAERRGGFTCGISYGLGYSSASGYPNNLSQIGDPAYERNVSALGAGNSIWLGGALRDWFTFGIGVSGRGATEGDLLSANSAFVLRLEGFPLYSLGGAYRDLGIFTELGAGAGVILDADEEVVADGGALGLVGLGAFYEPWTFWHFSTGPMIQYTHEFSESLASHSIVLGWRLALYGVQP